MKNTNKENNLAFQPCQDVRQRIIANATKTGKEAFPYTSMAFRMAQAALK